MYKDKTCFRHSISHAGSRHSAEAGIDLIVEVVNMRLHIPEHVRGFAPISEHHILDGCGKRWGEGHKALLHSASRQSIDVCNQDISSGLVTRGVASKQAVHAVAKIVGLVRWETAAVPAAVGAMMGNLLARCRQTTECRLSWLDSFRICMAARDRPHSCEERILHILIGYSMTKHTAGFEVHSHMGEVVPPEDNVGPGSSGDALGIRTCPVIASLTQGTG